MEKPDTLIRISNELSEAMRDPKYWECRDRHAIARVSFLMGMKRKIENMDDKRKKFAIGDIGRTLKDKGHSYGIVFDEDASSALGGAFIMKAKIREYRYVFLVNIKSVREVFLVDFIGRLVGKEEEGFPYVPFQNPLFMWSYYLSHCDWENGCYVDALFIRLQDQLSQWGQKLEGGHDDEPTPEEIRKAQEEKDNDDAERRRYWREQI